jgi:hypothetical protein
MEDRLAPIELHSTSVGCTNEPYTQGEKLELKSWVSNYYYILITRVHHMKVLWGIVLSDWLPLVLLYVYVDGQCCVHLLLSLYTTGKSWDTTGWLHTLFYYFSILAHIGKGWNKEMWTKLTNYVQGFPVPMSFPLGRKQQVVVDHSSM